MGMGEAGGYWLDRLRSEARGADPKVLAEWSEIIEGKANVCLKDAFVKIKFEVSVDENSKFKLDMDAATPESILCLLKAIQGCLELMPSTTKTFYAALMESLASEAEKRDP